MSYTQPLTLLFLLIGLAGMYRVRRRCHGGGLAMPTLGLVGLLALSWPPVAWLLAQPLEFRYPARPFPPGDAQAMVVLSGSIEPRKPETPYAIAGPETYERCEYAAWLHRRWRPLPVLACGGIGPGGPDTYAGVMRRLIEGMGVPADRIWTEERSQSTHENAVFGAEILRRQGIRRIVLITSAYHMPRAELCFRKAGLEVIPAPCGFNHIRNGTFLPGWHPILRNENTLHELVGLAIYRLRGWI